MAGFQLKTGFFVNPDIIVGNELNRNDNKEVSLFLFLIHQVVSVEVIPHTAKNTGNISEENDRTLAPEKSRDVTSR